MPDPLSHPLCVDIENQLVGLCPDLFACWDKMCTYIVDTLISGIYESTTVQQVVHLNFVLVVLILTVLGLSFLVRELRFRRRPP